jgi:hypothetical protein
MSSASHLSKGDFVFKDDPASRFGKGGESNELGCGLKLGKSEAGLLVV